MTMRRGASAASSFSDAVTNGRGVARAVDGQRPAAREPCGGHEGKHQLHERFLRLLVGNLKKVELGELPLAVMIVARDVGNCAHCFRPSCM